MILRRQDGVGGLASPCSQALQELSRRAAPANPRGIERPVPGHRLIKLRTMNVTIEVLAPNRSHCLRQLFRRDMKHSGKRSASIKDQKDGAGNRGRAQQETNKRGDVAGHEQAVGA